jgi:ATP-dependent Lon protease
VARDERPIGGATASSTDERGKTWKVRSKNVWCARSATYVVNKRDALRAGFELMPRFVTEFLLAKARSRQADMTIQGVRSRLREHWVDADRAGEFLSRLMRQREAKLIALLEVDPRPDRDERLGRIAQVPADDIKVDPRLAEQYPELLYGGLWGTCVLAYDPTHPKKPEIKVVEFTPYQLTRPNVDAVKAARRQFTTEEWIEVLISSAGYRPAAFGTLRERLLLLARLVPLVQPNVNLIELGPRGTGKSYLLRNLSPRVYLLAGARATPARLLYDLHTKTVGIVGKKKVVVFDEIGATHFSDDSLVAALKDFMESGQISRGGRNLVSDCSLVFTGNLDLGPDGRPSRDYLHLFEALPRRFADAAVGDRLHGFIPGWELPKISDDVLADGLGLLSDYFGEVLGSLRNEVGFLEKVREQVPLENATIRDKNAIERITAGLLKLLYPDGRVEDVGLRQAAELAIDLRSRVHQQLERMSPGEYAPKSIRSPE